MFSAWHFYFALVLVIKMVCSNFGIALFPPLNKALCDYRVNKEF
ncbi:DUF3265 domain-containing protein [Photobacterium phosphoreum]|nr:DUF3265 domain-containing protein [Photobacterium phosphoreum]